MNVFDLACEKPWLIRQSMLDTILEIAARENPTRESVAAKLGRPLENTRTVDYRGGQKGDGPERVAVIPVTGAIFRHANLFCEISGGTSTEVLSTDFRAALDDPQISSIVMDFASEGGHASGIAELAAMIFEVRDRKPCVAYVDDLACSAAYWLASACCEVVTSPTGLLGSIGAVMAMRDPNDPNSRSAKKIEFVSSQSPKKRPDPTTESGKSQFQTLVDDLAGVFVADVAKYRGVSVDTVLSDFGQGGLFTGQLAVDAQLADRVGTFESVVADLTAGRYPQKYKGKRSSFIMATADEKPPTMTVSIEEFEKLKAESAAKEARLAAAEAVIKAGQEREFQSSLSSITAKAMTFADSITKGPRASVLPASRDALAVLHAQALLDDAGITTHRPLVVNKTLTLSPITDGATALSRVKAVETAFAGLPPHGLTQEAVSKINLEIRSNDADSGAEKAARDKKELAEALAKL